jgi:REP element-mobilizing transposase RayT
MQNKIQLEPEIYYHIYNHANGFENFFNDKYDYQNFLNRYIKYIVPICETFAYCLMPNHFHFFVQVKPETELIKILKINNETHKVDSDTISYRFSHCFNGYAQSFNKKHQRKGSLFRSTFERKLVKTEKYFIKLVHYIHSNPVKDDFVENVGQWENSSYNSFFSNADSFLKKDRVIKYFGDLENFKFIHQKSYNFE